MSSTAYSIQLSAGLSLVEETHRLLDLWQPGMGTADLQKAALESGLFPTITSRRLRNIVVEGFKPRYLIDDGTPAIRLKQLRGQINTRQFNQLLFIYTCRANLVLADYIRQIYWPAYRAARDCLGNEEARQFLRRANEEGKTVKPWSVDTIERVAQYLTNCCSEFGLLETGNLKVRKIISYRLEETSTIYLAYDLHCAGLGDNSLLNHPDWGLFGMERNDVLEELKRLALQGWWIVQSAGEATRISWKYPSMETVIHALTQG